MGISTKFTHADLLVMPEDGKRWEIIDGELLVSPSAKSVHQAIVAALQEELFAYLRAHRIGKVYADLDIILDDLNIVQPDLVFVKSARLGIVQDWVRGVPDLVIEVLSPSTTANDRGPKLKAYARFGVSEYWIVDPNACAIEVYQLGQEGYEPPRIFREHESLISLVLPGFALPVGKVFESD